MMERLNEWKQIWSNHRQILEQLLEKIGDEHLHFRPWEGAMSFSELALHVTSSNLAFVNVVQTGGQLQIPELPDCQTMDDVRKAVRGYTEQTESILTSLDESDLNAESPIPHPKLAGKRIILIQAMVEHEIHHKAQLFVYARMAGVETLPFFR